MKAWGFAILAGLAMGFLVWPSAARAALFPPKVLRLASLPMPHGYGEATVYVIDTPGACLYVLLGAWDPSIAALPKPAAGCE